MPRRNRKRKSNGHCNRCKGQPALCLEYLKKFNVRTHQEIQGILSVSVPEIS